MLAVSYKKVNKFDCYVLQIQVFVVEKHICNIPYKRTWEKNQSGIQNRKL